MTVTNSSISPNPSTSVTSGAHLRVWDLPVRLFHWLFVATMLIAFLSSEEDSALAPWHIPAGWVVAVLIAFRLVWGFVGGEHARFANFLKPGKIAHHLGDMFTGKPARSVGHNALGGVAIIALLGSAGGIVYTGATMQGESGEGLHEALANILLVLIALHVIAVIAMSLLTRENLISAFITGNKRAALHPGVPDAQPPATLAVPLALITIGGSAYAATALDPLAFTPGVRAEVGEQGHGARAESEHDND
ncbi:cytochrome b/b6 domain-containing protein [Novosphingobium hassiacum]|uniref:cytochrome b/b6 domain-containing protein n=1 Tax=Novosphingobium hassiacum TaxID=173676 RepID=UPI0031B5CF1D